MPLYRHALLLTFACGWIGSSWAIDSGHAQSLRRQAVQRATQSSSATPLATLEAMIPTDVDSLASIDAAVVRQTALDVDAWAFAATASSDPFISVRTALESKRRVDELLDRTLALRTRIADVGGDTAAKAEDRRRDAARGLLRTAAALIELSGRLRYLQNDVVRNARARLTDVRSRERLVDLFIEYRSTVGAAQSAGDLFVFASTPYHEKLLRLIARAGQTSLLPDVVRYVDDASRPTAMRLFAAEIVRVLGLPQPPRPNPVEDLPEPVVTPDEMYELVAALDATQLEEQGQARREALLTWLDGRRRNGVTEDAYRVGSFEVRPGDWLLMRNPSPYNLFTDLSPGLFTHVGVVAAETGADGIRRFVIVDVPERGDRVPAVNVETYLERTLHYVFLRDGDAEAARAMGRTAAEVIDNPSQFDLNFRSDRVLSLKGKPLDGVKIHTYCAGLLLLCGLRTDVPWRDYFPLTERQAGGYTVENVAKIGLSLGADFVSPSGALFSKRLGLIGRREPMYDPRREVEEAVFDHFALLLMQRRIRAQGNWYHDLRLRLAQTAQGNPLLAEALAGAVGVSADTDLVSAAKAAAVVETLDEVAQGAGRDFEAARAAVRGTPPTEGNPKPDVRRYEQLRARHAELASALAQGRISPRNARLALVRYYVDAGKLELERRFFSDEEQ